MSRLSELGIAKRLALTVVIGAIAPAALATIGMVTQHRLDRQGGEVAGMQSCLAALNATIEAARAGEAGRPGSRAPPTSSATSSDLSAFRTDLHHRETVADNDATAL